MDETAAELDGLQALLDRSFARASAHLRSIMTPERRLSAAQLVRLVPVPAVLNLATVTAAGAPRLSAVDGHLLHGRWHFSTAADSPKARQLRARVAVSVSYTPRDGVGVFCHGHAVLLDGDARERLREHLGACYGSDPESWSESAIDYVRVDPDWLVGFAMSPPAPP